MYSLSNFSSVAAMIPNLGDLQCYTSNILLYWNIPTSSHLRCHQPKVSEVDNGCGLLNSSKFFLLFFSIPAN